MDVSNLNLILWVPFALVVILSSLRFAISGFQRGPWMALVNLAVSLAAAFVAIPVAKMVAPLAAEPLAPVLAELVPVEALAELPGGEAAVQGILSMLAAMLLFPGIFFLLSLLARLVTGLLLRPLLTTRKGGARITGLAVGVAHALVYPLLLLLPLYGSLAIFTPMAQTAMVFQPDQEPQTQAYIQAIAEHPVVRLAGTEPVQWYYSNLSTVELENGTLDVAQVSQVITQILDRHPQRQEEPDSKLAFLQELFAQIEEALPGNVDREAADN